MMNNGCRDSEVKDSHFGEKSNYHQMFKMRFLSLRETNNVFFSDTLGTLTDRSEASLDELHQTASMEITNTHRRYETFLLPSSFRPS